LLPQVDNILGSDQALALEVHFSSLVPDPVFLEKFRARMS